MKAAVLYELGKPLVIEEGLSIPRLREGQVFVEIKFAGVCHSQLMEVSGSRGEDKFLPHTLGHEGVGVVLDIGPNVSKVKRGDTVILGWLKGSGLDSGGTYYLKGEKKINAGPVTTFSSHSVVSEDRLFLWPAQLPLKAAVLFGCALPTGAGLVCRDARPKAGDVMCIVGLGGIGLSALLVANTFPLSELIVVEPSKRKRELALRLGATHALEPNAFCREHILGITNGMGVDVAIEAAGKGSTIEFAFDLVRFDGGRCIFASHPSHDTRITLDPFDLIRGKHICGSWGGSTDPDEHLPELITAFAEGRLPLMEIVENPMPLSEINEAMASLSQGAMLRPLIDCES